MIGADNCHPEACTSNAYAGVIDELSISRSLKTKRKPTPSSPLT
jgi:hypothetical protein